MNDAELSGYVFVVRDPLGSARDEMAMARFRNRNGDLPWVPIPPPEDSRAAMARRHRHIALTHIRSVLAREHARRITDIPERSLSLSGDHERDASPSSRDDGQST